VLHELPQRDEALLVDDLELALCCDSSKRRAVERPRHASRRRLPHATPRLQRLAARLSIIRRRQRSLRLSAQRVAPVRTLHNAAIEALDGAAQLEELELAVVAQLNRKQSEKAVCRNSAKFKSSLSYASFQQFQAQSIPGAFNSSWVASVQPAPPYLGALALFQFLLPRRRQHLLRWLRRRP